MARRNLYNNPQDVTLPPESHNEMESIIESKTIPDDADPMRSMETQPEFDDSESQLGKERYKPQQRQAPRFERERKYERTVVDDEIEVPARVTEEKRNRRVVGWMVGVKGSCRGVDYRLHEGKNYIGRDARCEVDVEDPKVSAGNVAQVVFDPRSKHFFSSDCDGTATICYQNGEPLLGRSEIKIYDRIELGDSMLLFVPLCGEAFTWEDKVEG